MSTNTRLWRKQFTEDQLDLWGEDLAKDMISYYHDMVKRDPKTAEISLACIQKIKEYYFYDEARR